MKIVTKKIEMKVYNFEVYLCNPKSGETGWDIQMITVFGNTKAKATDNLVKFVPNFDTVRVLNWESKLSGKDMWRERDCYDSGLRFFYTHNNLPTSLTLKE